MEEKVENKYRKLFILYQESPQTFKKTVEKIGFQKFDFKTLFPFLNGRNNADPAEYIIRRLGKGFLDTSFLLKVATDKKSKLRVRKCARILLMENFGETLSVSVLFQFLEARDMYTQELAQKLLESLPKKSFSVNVLNTLRTKTKSAFAESVAQDLLAKHFPESLKIKTLFSFLLTEKSFSARASKILEAYPMDKVDCKVLFEYLRSENTKVRHVAVRMIDRYPSTKLSIETLMAYLRSRNMHVKDGARRLLVKHFSDELLFKDLTSFLRSKNRFVTNGTAIILIRRFPEKLTLQRLRGLYGKTSGKALAQVQELSTKKYPNAPLFRDSDEEVQALFH